jgi:hypothetical protein
MHHAIRRFAIVAAAVGTSVLAAACGGSGAGLIPSADAGPLEHYFEEVGRLARTGNGSCTATEEALERTEREFARISASLAATLRAKIQEGLTHLHTQALEECAQMTSTTSSTTTTKTHTSEVIVPVTSTSSSATSAAPPTTSAANGEETPGGGGTPAPGAENGSPGGAEAQGGQPNENGGGGLGNRGEGR